MVAYFAAALPVASHLVAAEQFAARKAQRSQKPGLPQREDVSSQSLRR
jgi:hypothetical protein